MQAGRFHGPFRNAGRVALAVLAAASLTACTAGRSRPRAAVSPPAVAEAPYLDPAVPVADRVTDLLGRMSLEDKVGQMLQVERSQVTPGQLTAARLGSVMSAGGSAPQPNTPAAWADMYGTYQRAAMATPLGIPMIYGVDAVHGNNDVAGSTIFPHNIGLGATRDPALVRKIGRATAEEVTGAGLDWTFAPCLCVARDDRWGRTYESFGETPELVSSMASVVDGLQGPALDAPGSVLATAKHYLGDGGTTGGRDRGDTRIDEEELRSVHLPPFRAAVDRGVGSVMVSDSSWNGRGLHASKYLVTDVLKGELGFTGFVVSDSAGVDRLDSRPGFTEVEVAAAVNAGVDMLMVPRDWRRFLGVLRSAVETRKIPPSRIDDANRRILTKKFELGLFERPYPDRSFASTIGNDAHRQLARQAVRESQVVLKNARGVLPLSNSGRYFVAGSNADDLGGQAGGWTITRQGGSGDTITGTSILQGIREAANTGSVTYERTGLGVDGSYDAAIAVVGERPYAEQAGDRPRGISLGDDDLKTIVRLRQAGIPVVVVVVSGRPVVLDETVGLIDGLVASWLPGSEGGGVADVLFGDWTPTAKLPVSWPRSNRQHPVNAGDGKDALFGYGFGLTYGR